MSSENTVHGIVCQADNDDRMSNYVTKVIGRLPFDRVEGNTVIFSKAGVTIQIEPEMKLLEIYKVVEDPGSKPSLLTPSLRIVWPTKKDREERKKRVKELKEQISKAQKELSTYE